MVESVKNHPQNKQIQANFAEKFFQIPTFKGLLGSFLGVQVPPKTFGIWKPREFANINGLKLTRLPDQFSGIRAP